MVSDNDNNEWALFGLIILINKLIILKGKLRSEVRMRPEDKLEKMIPQPENSKD